MGFRVGSTVGFKVSNGVEIDLLRESCELVRFLSAYHKPLLLCGLGCGVCRYNGKKVSFLSCSDSGFLRVKRICDKLLDGVFC